MVWSGSGRFPGDESDLYRQRDDHSGAKSKAVHTASLPLATTIQWANSGYVGTQKIIRIKSSQEITQFSPTPAAVFEWGN